MWPSRISNSVHVSVWLCRPMKGSITQGLHASNVAYGHLEKDIANGMRLYQRHAKRNIEYVYLPSNVSQWHGALANGFIHECGMCSTGKCCWPIACNINKGLHTFGLLCAHFLGDLIFCLSALARKH